MNENVVGKRRIYVSNTVMDLMMTRSVENPFKGPKLTDQLSVKPKLINQIQLQVDKVMRW